MSKTTFLPTSMIYAFGIGIVSLLFAQCAEVQGLADTIDRQRPLTKEEIAKALKEALRIGVTNGSETLAKLDGYYQSPYKILLPAEARKVTEKLAVVPGFKNVEEEIVKRLNRAAEDAATKAKPIFIDAITGITIQDAWGILRGADNAATEYLKTETYDSLYAAFQPIILASLNKFDAVEYWEKAITAYNKLPFVAEVNPRLDDYVNQEALKGLFGMVAEEEAGIRNDISKRTSDLLRRVFGYQEGV